MEREGGGWQHFTSSEGMPSDTFRLIYTVESVPTSKRSLGTLVKKKPNRNSTLVL
jgi:hypothetical protein